MLPAKKRTAYKTLLKTFLVLAGLAGPITYFALMPDMPREPLGAQAVTTRAFSDPNGKAACELPAGSQITITAGWYEPSNKNRWSIAHDKYGRPENGEFTVVIPITKERAVNSCLHTAQMGPRDFVVARK